MPRPRREAVAVVPLLVAAALSGAAAAGASPAWEPAARAGIQVSVATHIDSTGREAPLVRVSVPYRALVFTRDGGTFRARVRVTVIAKHDGRRAGGGVEEAAAEVADYAATRGDQQLGCAVPLQLGAGGRVTLEAEILVVGTSRRWRERLEYVVGRGLGVPLYFADFAWNAAMGPTSGITLGPEDDSLRVSVTLARRPNVPDWPAAGVTLAALVAPPGRGDKPPPRLVTVPPQAIGDPPAVIRIAWAADDLPLGRLALSLRLECGDPAAPEQLDLDPPRPFVNLAVRWRDDAQWRQQVSWLDGIVPSATRSELLLVPPDRRREAWQALWPPLAAAAGLSAADLEREHLLRIIAADTRFGGLGRGALTDRGRIWIRCGEPDSVEERGADLAYEGRWEIWYYHTQRLVFTFYDAHGLGDFRLVASGTM
ncbi:MAG: GWxTD domain-containing protein [Candidatus Krumholzibacteriia bacterium]